MSESIATQQHQHPPTPLETFKLEIKGLSKLVQALLKADDAGRGRWLAEVFAAVRANPKLLQADRPSLLDSIIQAASLGLSVNPLLGEAWLIPRKKNFKDRNDQWQSLVLVSNQTGKNGLIKMGWRSKMLDAIHTDTVYDGEMFDYESGSNPYVKHRPDVYGKLRTGLTKDIIAAYASVYVIGSTRPIIKVLGAEELYRIAAMSGNPNDNEWSDVWTDHFAEMAEGAALKRVCKKLPRSDELRDMHLSVERETMIDVGKEPPQSEYTEQIAAAIEASAAQLVPEPEQDGQSPAASARPRPQPRRTEPTPPPAQE
jgi:recombination protein RecT